MYKSSNFRKSQPQQDSTSGKYAAQVKQLKEAFPTWSDLDLESLLVEVNGDAQVASLRILEGHAEQWGNVTRKKDKKSSTPTSSHPKDSSAGRERGDFRGGRGGRAARGGPGRGGARGVSARGGHQEVNGHRAKPSQSAEASKDASAGRYFLLPLRGEVILPPSTVQRPTLLPLLQSLLAPAPAHAPAPAQASAPAPAPAKGGSTPATSKLSWAQIARKPQEKPVPPPAPVSAPPPAAPSAPAPAPAQAQQSEPAPSTEPTESAPASTGWEEPTTVQAPTWDDEPRPSQPAEPIAPAEEPKPAQPEPTVEESVPESAPSVVSPPAQQPAPESPAALPPKPLTPSIQARSTPISHRTNPKFKTTDQPVVLPASFGSGVEKIGMQFGSLSLGGEDLDS
ncbi:hypothetical protein ONZ51_g11110 [Trametes cubensis]|uniref:RNA polymerase II degradation factor 1 n=1 Tax=Trametes cubensis TaxID=1111947 RepID=A0AAD7TIS6_9APHY|nr:hypothetical protein ONZ51_g11110 [Trametes cubensis]